MQIITPMYVYVVQYNKYFYNKYFYTRINHVCHAARNFVALYSSKEIYCYFVAYIQKNTLLFYGNAAVVLL